MKKINPNVESRVYVGIILIIFFFVMYIFFKKPSKETNAERMQRYCHEERVLSYKGVVKNIWEGRGMHYVINSSVTFYPYGGCYKKKYKTLPIEINDSIYKPSNSFDLYIYKNANPDSVIYLPCDFDCSSLVEKD